MRILPSLVFIFGGLSLFILHQQQERGFPYFWLLAVALGFLELCRMYFFSKNRRDH